MNSLRSTAKKKKPCKPTEATKCGAIVKDGDTLLKDPNIGDFRSALKAMFNLGGTRQRLFVALAASDEGMSMRGIKEATGMLLGSGHLGVILGEELKKGRIRCVPGEEKTPSGGFREVNHYRLTSKGRRDLQVGKVESRRAGTRLGGSWSAKRRQAHVPKQKGKK